MTKSRQSRRQFCRVSASNEKAVNYSQLLLRKLFNSENRVINIIKGTGYQNGQFFFKSIPENVIKKLRSGDNEKMKKIIWEFSLSTLRECDTTSWPI
jgi:hypothetical protein